jgi:hypothetical protein
MQEPKTPDDVLFEGLAESAASASGAMRASTRLRSRIFSKLNLLQAAGGPLLSLGECKAAGGQLCVFEELVRIAPVGEPMHQANPCRVCHARLLAEHVEGAPIWWPGCPYVQFQNRGS